MPELHDHRTQIVDGSRVAPASVDLADAVVQGVRAGFGVLSLAVGVTLRTLGESPATVPRQAGTRIPVSEVADLLVGTAWGAARLSGRTAATGARIAAPMVGLVLRPPLVPRRLQPAYGMHLLTERWQRDRPETLRTLGRLSATALPGAVDAVLDQVDVEQVATVTLERVDLERLATVALERVDMERVATVVLNRVDLTRIASIVLERLDLNELAVKLLNQLDIDKVVAQLLNQLDVDAVAVNLLNRIDIDDVVTQLLNQLDLTQLVLERVDLQRLVAGALERLDVTAVVVDQVDLGMVISAALQHVDLTAVVVDQVDLGMVVSAALQHVDLTEIVMRQVDLVGVAEYVVDAIDLPEIIRDSTGSVASEAVVGMRMQGIDADAAVGRIVDRMLRRRRQHRTDDVQGKPGSPEGPADRPTRTSG